MSRPRLLFLCQTLPFPPDGGVHLRSYNILRLLSEVYDVTALCFYRAKTRPSDEKLRESLAGLSQLGRAEAFPIPQEHSRLRLIWDHGRSVLTRLPYTRFAYDSTEFRARVRQLLRDERFDLVHVDSLDLSTYLREFTDVPVVCTHHNIESALLRRRSTTEDSSIFGRYVALQAAFMEAEEKRWCDRVALNVVVSRQDQERLRELAPRAPSTVVPNGVDTSFFQPGRSEREGILFVGGYGWYPNRDGMQYFADSILPALREKHPTIPITWVGRAPEAFVKEFDAKYGIRMTGYVDDVRPYLERAACYIVPLRVGGGTRLKILDAWASGNAVVSTSIGCEGLDAVDGQNILVRNDPAEFAAAVGQVVEAAELGSRIGAAGRRTAEDAYEWEVIGTRMLRSYDALLSSKPPSECTNHPTSIYSETGAQV